MFDGLEFRGFKHAHVEALANYSGVPVWNGLTDDYHPTQALATFLTIKEKFGDFQGLTIAYIGDGRNNVANSLMICCSKLGVDFINITPKVLNPDPVLVAECENYAAVSGATITITDSMDAVKNANALYTDVWYSMGEESKKAERLALLKSYQINQTVMSQAKPGAIFMHCLPANKGMEVTEDVFEGPDSTVFDEAENRLHTIKAIMVSMLGENE